MSDKVDIWLPIYVGDYMGDTMHLTTEQHGAYLLIIFAYWRNRGPIQDNDIRLSGISKLSIDAWSIHRDILKEFFDTKSKPGYWVHRRIEKELTKALKNKETNEKRARKAAKERWKGHKKDVF